MSYDGITDSLREGLATFLKDPLHNPAPKFIETERQNILLDSWHYGAHAGWVCRMTHLDDDLLHDVIAIKVERAIFNSVGRD